MIIINIFFTEKIVILVLWTTFAPSPTLWSGKDDDDDDDDDDNEEEEEEEEEEDDDVIAI